MKKSNTIILTMLIMLSCAACSNGGNNVNASASNLAQETERKADDSVTRTPQDIHIVDWCWIYNCKYGGVLAVKRLF